MKNFWTIFVLAMVFFSCKNIIAEEKMQVIYPEIGGDNDRSTYPIALLKLIMEKSGFPYEIKKSPGYMTQGRAIYNLKKENEITVIWVGTSDEFEDELLPIRIPITRGLLGNRVFIINKNNQPLFDKVNNLIDLQKYPVVQGIGWSDIEILQKAGLRVDAGSYEQLFTKVEKNREPYFFSRGLNEAFLEVKTHNKELPDLAVEKKILLVYPFDLFYFTNKANFKLAHAINWSLILRMILENFSFSNYDHKKFAI